MTELKALLKLAGDLEKLREKANQKVIKEKEKIARNISVLKEMIAIPMKILMMCIVMTDVPIQSVTKHMIDWISFLGQARMKNQYLNTM